MQPIDPMNPNYLMLQSRQHARIAAKLKKASRLIAEGLKAHGELRSHAMEALGLGHGHANALAAYYLKPECQSGPAAVKKAATKKKLDNKRKTGFYEKP